MKKNFTMVVTLSMVVAVLCLSSCSKSEDDKNGGEDVMVGVAGTWFGYACTNSDASNLETNHTLTLILNSDGTGKYDEYEVLDANKCNFTYIMEGTTKGKAYISSRGINIYFMVEGGKMYVYGHGYGDDLDFLLNKQ